MDRPQDSALTDEPWLTAEPGPTERSVAGPDLGQPGTDAPSETEEERLLRFVERFAMTLADAGMQRMPARVFAYVLADDAERYTAAELASALRVSPAAISGAVRTLVQAKLLGKEREPGERVDTYRVYDDNLWYTIIMQREQIIEPFERIAAEGAELLGPDTPGGRRMRETYEFYAFLRRKLSGLMDEWLAYKRTVLDGPS